MSCLFSDTVTEQWKLDNFYNTGPKNCKKAHFSQDGSLLAVLFDEVSIFLNFDLDLSFLSVGEF